MSRLRNRTRNSHIRTGAPNRPGSKTTEHLFAVLSLALASVGLYGVISFDVAQRSQEIGVRLALGAESSGVLRLILRQGLRLTALGVVLGLLGSVALSRFLGSQLYEVGAMCPLTFVAVVVILFTVATAASLVPARRATRVDPLVAMRSE